MFPSSFQWELLSGPWSHSAGMEINRVFSIASALRDYRAWWPKTSSSSWPCFATQAFGERVTLGVCASWEFCFGHYVKLASEPSSFPVSLAETQWLDKTPVPTHFTLTASLCIFLTLSKSQGWDAIKEADGHHINSQLISCFHWRPSNHTWQVIDNEPCILCSMAQQ